MERWRRREECQVGMVPQHEVRLPQEERQIVMLEEGERPRELRHPCSQH